jgi:general secretion pathway protein N
LRLFTYLEDVPEPQIKAPPPLKMATLPPKETFAEITARPIFNQDRRPDPLKPAVDMAMTDGGVEPAADLAQFRIVGIVTDRDTQLALVQTPAGTTTKIRAGDTLEGWRIEKIDVAGVTATDGIRSSRLVIPRAQNAAPTP